MKSRFLRIVFVCTCLVAATGLSAFAQGQGPGGPPHSGPPPGSPPSGGPPPGNPSSGGPGGPGGSLPPNSSSKRTGSAARSSLQFGPVGRWWDDKSVVQTIGLRREQQRKMDVIFNANKPAILESYKAFVQEQSELETISKDPKIDQARVFAAIDAVSQARASLQKATTQMLLQIRQQMDSNQITKLEKLR